MLQNNFTMEGNSTSVSQANKPGTKKLKAIILGAGRGVSRLDSSKSYPFSLKEDSHGKSVLDWQLLSFRAFGITDIVFVGGYHIEKIIQSYPDLKFYYNPEWQSTGTLYSLFCAEKEMEGACLISYSDVVFRPDVIEKILSGSYSSNIAIGLDVSGKEDLVQLSRNKRIETAYETGGRLLEIGFNINPRADGCKRGIFTGLCYANEEGIKLLKNGYSENRKNLQIRKSGNEQGVKHAGITDLIQYVIEKGEDISAVGISANWARIDDSLSLSRFVFATKAQTLENLQSVLKSATVLHQCRFTVDEWIRNEEHIINRIRSEIKSEKLIIRSSALNEDSWNCSMAGCFHSEINVDIGDTDAIRSGVKKVIDSFIAKPAGRMSDQIFVQPYVSDTKLSGVIFTRELEHGSPYFIINYTDKSCRTDLVTAGNGSGLHTEVVYKFGTYRGSNPNIVRLISLAKELEQITCHDSLDIEFAINKYNECFLFQVRPLVAHLNGRGVQDGDVTSELDSARQFLEEIFRRRPHLYGDTTILAEMPDWNPAEIIGSAPRPLALSLYQYLITDTVWGRSRAAAGYRDTYPEPLVVSLIGRPYVDCRASFNSFIPATMPPDIAERLVNHYIDRLGRNPELHDKVEFEIAITCFSFNFDSQADMLIEAGFNKRDIGAIRGSLLELTNSILGEKHLTAQEQLIQIKRLSERRSQWIINAGNEENNILRSVRYLLDDCIHYGTLPFSILARFAFIGTSFLKSLTALGVLTADEYEGFLMSVPTVATGIVDDMDRLARGEVQLYSFLETYGHLRPGTYDILSPRYDENPELYFSNTTSADKSNDNEKKPQINPVNILHDKIQQMEALLAQSGLKCSPFRLADFICQSIQAREYAKFEFTKNLSAALKLIGVYAERTGLTRDDMSFVPVQSILSLAINSPSSIVKQEFKRIAGRNRKRYDITRAVQLPSLISSSNDMESFSYQKNIPNFITSLKVCAETVNLTTYDKMTELKGKIVLIESADPGYDWIFGHQIKGIITKYGGVASHMSIRAAEFGLPSAIGCGETIFRRLVCAKKIQMDCASRQIHVIE